MKLVGPFTDVIGFIEDKFVRNWLDLLCFLLSGETYVSRLDIAKFEVLENAEQINYIKLQECLDSPP